MTHSVRFFTFIVFVVACQMGMPIGNVLGQSEGEASSSKQIDPAQLLEKPPAIPEHLREMFDRMEASNRRSQDVFRKLSTAQMNFKPSNGSHTPRWNAEHMAGRQLLFFSQIYNALDPNIPVFNWNPAQMPPDYKARHPEWSGKDEARAMQRVDDFCRRYAYLLKDTQLDDKPPATRWPSLKALLLQMERHYDEHTANVIKKFDLPDWPKQ
ncbi:MAG: DinB family protein [Planctomycetota bacterium]